MYKGYKIRLYPTKEQEELLWKHIGCCRFIWNYMLNRQEAIYLNKDNNLSGFDMINLITELKKEHTWLSSVSITSLQIVCRNLDKAYKKFYTKVAGKPMFKSKKISKQKYPTRPDRLYFYSEKFVVIEKIGKVLYKTDFKFNIGNHKLKFFNTSVEYILGKWFLSFNLEYENQMQELNDFSMGIDLGIKELAVVSHDNVIQVFHNINKSKKMRNLEKRIKYYQRSINKKQKDSKNREREKLKMRKLYAKQSNIRNNYIHQITRKLVNEKPQKVVMEDLNVMDLMKNHYMAKAIQEQNFYEFKRQMQYKCEWAGIEFVLADRFYPSSKTCSQCGHIKKDLKLSDRIYKCEKCGLIIDRDENAAKNLEKYVA